VDRLRESARRARAAGRDNRSIARALEEEAERIRAEDLEACRTMGRLGSELVPDGATVLTHCNAGGLATAGYGTALGVVRGAVDAGKKVRVLADETRPLWQGARLTAWELMRDEIETVLICDNSAGSLMRAGEIDLVVVGSDRIAANGDVANKIGTYAVAVLAHEHGLPFYVAAPLSTVDFACPHGDQIPIEEREPAEVAEPFGTRVAAPGVGVRNPAFDITPARYVSAIVTERGIARAPYLESLAALASAPRQG
jgi:methylthioribose-1-phosphate isomerase